MKHCLLFFLLLNFWACKNQQNPQKSSKDTTKQISKIQPDTTQQPTPAHFEIEENEFVIHFPAMPLRVEDTTDRDVEYSVQIGDSVNYLLYYRDYKESTIQKMGAKKFLQNQEKQVIDKLGFPKEEIFENKEIELEGFPGISLKAGSKKNTFLIYRIFLVGNRLYQLGISHTKRFPTEEEQKFFESFKLKNTKISRS
ncbi:MAG: hypothetical protein RMJ97_04855 [Raineya sp.]|nr:hypothetical protein [Raineya sp.]MDW8296196.1 hypothetical protein [Raineya sp.]